MNKKYYTSVTTNPLSMSHMTYTKSSGWPSIPWFAILVFGSLALLVVGMAVTVYQEFAEGQPTEKYVTNRGMVIQRTTNKEWNIYTVHLGGTHTNVWYTSHTVGKVTYSTPHYTTSENTMDVFVRKGSSLDAQLGKALGATTPSVVTTRRWTNAGPEAIHCRNEVTEVR